MSVYDIPVSVSVCDMPVSVSVCDMPVSVYFTIAAGCFVGEVRILLVDFAVGINSCSHNIRKITPVLTDTPAPSTVTDVQLQV